MAESDAQELHSLFNTLFQDYPKEGEQNVLVEKIKSFLPRLVNTYLADKSCKYKYRNFS
jgi:hypothetical protein